MTFISWPSVFALYQIDLSTSWDDIILYLKIMVGHNDLNFMAQCFCLTSTSWYDMILDLKINVGHNDLYFMARVLPYIWLIYDMILDLKINVGHNDFYFMAQGFALCLIDVWHDSWPKNKCWSQWLLFYGLGFCPISNWCMTWFLT